MRRRRMISVRDALNLHGAHTQSWALALRREG
jgi:hypothetical protein